MRFRDARQLLVEGERVQRTVVRRVIDGDVAGAAPHPHLELVDDEQLTRRALAGATLVEICLAVIGPDRPVPRKHRPAAVLTAGVASDTSLGAGKLRLHFSAP